ncbi:MAG: protein-glutamate O-methyltransferase [Syntrophobacterales bacterium]|jgi:chemotaxis protein methyltransferase CheR|nr:protein-glutamate O-methyltransferase [Syntrophobacterales bacterium]
MDYELQDHEFEKISRLVYDISGIALHEGKKEMVRTRLIKRLRNRNFRSFSDYYRYVTAPEGTDELIAMIDTLSTNLTNFFREDGHFARLKSVVQSWRASVRGNGRPPQLRIWSAGCSTGEEPYTIAMVISEILPPGFADLKILATDISTVVLKKAAEGVYTEDKVKNVPEALRRKYFLKGVKEWEGFYRVRENLRFPIEFVRLNLKESFSFKEPFDVIFCRNVMIYFDRKMQQLVVGRFHDCLKEGGWLFIGHSESLTGITHRFKYIEPSVYRK